MRVALLAACCTEWMRGLLPFYLFYAITARAEGNLWDLLNRCASLLEGTFPIISEYVSMYGEWLYMPNGEEASHRDAESNAAAAARDESRPSRQSSSYWRQSHRGPRYLEVRRECRCHQRQGPHCQHIAAPRENWR